MLSSIPKADRPARLRIFSPLSNRFSNIRKTFVPSDHVRITPEPFHQQTMLPDLRERLLHFRIFIMPDDIDEENIIPEPPPARTGFDLRHIDPPLAKRRDRPLQSPGLMPRSEEHTS